MITASPIAPGFVIQAGDLNTRKEPLTSEMRKYVTNIRAELNDVKHQAGIVSMARTDEPNSATTHFFILVGPAPHLDSKFSAFGTVTKGMEVVDAINQAPADGEKPQKPVKIVRASVAACKR